MTNYEKYRDELEKIMLSGDSFGIHRISGELNTCHHFTMEACYNCIFYRMKMTCVDARKEWLNAEAKEPEIDWQNVPINTPVEVTNSLRTWENATRAHFKEFIPGSELPFLVFSKGKTSFTATGTAAYVRARLIRDEDIQKYSLGAVGGPLFDIFEGDEEKREAYFSIDRR